MNMSFNSRLIGLGMKAPAVNNFIGKTFENPENPNLEKIFEGVQKKVCLLFMSRVGSTFLCDKLNRTGAAGTIREHMNIYHIKRHCEEHGVKGIDEYLEHIVQTTKTPNGVYAFKAQLDALVPLIQVGEFPDHVKEWEWITIHRKDRVAQAVSLARAKLTGRWHQKVGSDQPETKGPPEILFRHVMKNYENILAKEGANELFFRQNNLHPLRLYYEDFQVNQYNALRKIFVHLGIEMPAGLEQIAAVDQFVHMRDTYSEDVAAEFREKFLGE